MLSNRSTEMKPSIFSSTGFSSAARSRYCCLCSDLGQTSKITAIISTSLCVCELFFHLAQERPLLHQDELVLLGIAEVRHAVLVGAKPRAIALIFGETGEFEKPERDIVGALMRHPVAEAFAPTVRDDGEPAPRILLEHHALERVQLITDEDGDRHGNLRCLAAVIASASEAIHREGKRGLLRRFRSSQ